MIANCTLCCRPSNEIAGQGFSSQDSSAYKIVLRKLSYGPVMHLRQLASKAFAAVVSTKERTAEINAIALDLHNLLQDVNKVSWLFILLAYLYSV